VPPLNIYSTDSEYTRIYTPRGQSITLPFSDKMRKKRHDKAQYECRIIQFLVKFKYYYYYLSKTVYQLSIPNVTKVIDLFYGYHL